MMIDYKKLRHTMVETQLHPSNITDPDLLEAFLNIPREVFVTDPMKKPLAYLDAHLKMSNGGFMLSPLLVAKILQAADISRGDAVLVIGGTGYMAAIAGYLGATVFILNNDSVFAERTGKIFTEIKQDSVIFVEGDMTKGWQKEAPYNVILFSGGITHLDKDLADQMDNGGKIIAPMNQPDGKSGTVRLWEKWHHHVASRDVFDAYAPPLKGFAEVKQFQF